MNDLLQNANREFNTEDIDFRALERAKRYISDKDYFMFIAEKTNGGYFYSNSLHIYGYCSDPNYHSIEEMNKILKTQLKDIFGDSYSFGQDIFGNQFVYSERGIEMFNIESGDREVIGSGFKVWIEALENDVEYFTGEDLLKVLKRKRFY